jgi:hypothetical protein
MLDATERLGKKNIKYLLYERNDMKDEFSLSGS